jgi:hypothetical protein
MKRAVAVLVLALVVTACNADQKNADDKGASTSTTHVAAPLDVDATRGETIAPDPEATRVQTDGSGDETAAFSAAIDAALKSSYRRPGGPDGKPQAVVYVPPGVHRILRLPFRDNVRLEVDAGAVLQQAGGRNAKGGRSKYLVVWDGPDADTPLRNVSIVGVGAHDGDVKQQANPVESGWSITNAFTMNLDPKATDASDKVSGIELLNVDGFLIENVLSIQNADEHTPKWPTSAKAVFVLRPRDDSPIDGPFAQPRHGAIVHHYNVDSPRGYGPNQIGGATDVRVAGVFSRGGTALRLETDATKKKGFGGEIRGLQADTIVGVDCNRAVSFAPHAQKNYDVHVKSVVARGCSQGVIESDDEKLGKAKRGGFYDSTISDVTVTSGDAAQNPAKEGGGSQGAWIPGKSTSAFARDETAKWSVAYRDVHCTGAFTRKSGRIMLDGSMTGPMC